MTAEAARKTSGEMGLRRSQEAAAFARRTENTSAAAALFAGGGRRSGEMICQRPACAGRLIGRVKQFVHLTGPPVYKKIASLQKSNRGK
jgi:hypothetical protein